MTSCKQGKSINKLVFKIKTPKNFISMKDGDDIENYIMVDVVEFKSGKKLGTFKLCEVKLKFF